MFHLSEPFTLDSDTRLVLVTRLINPLSFSFIFFVCPPTMLLLSVWPFIEREFANIQDWSSLTVSLNVTHLTFAHSFTPSSVVHPANRLTSLWLLQFCLDHVLVVSVPLVMLSIWMIFSENKKTFHYLTSNTCFLHSSLQVALCILFGLENDISFLFPFGLCSVCPIFIFGPISNAFFCVYSAQSPGGQSSHYSHPHQWK